MPRGYLDTTHIDFPPNIDEGYIRGLETPRGVSWERVLQLIDQRLVAAGQVADPLVAQLVSFTTSALADGTTPEVFKLEEENEYGLGRPEYSVPRAHMLAFRRWRKAMAFTEQGLEEMTEREILRQVDSFLATFIRGARINVLTRLFSQAEVYVDRNTTATSPGFAGSGTGENVFAGTYPDGTALPDPYSHYYRDTTANRAATIIAMRDQLRRWHPGPYDLIASQAEINAIAALDDFVDAGSALIRPAQGEAEALVDANQYVGVFAKDIRVHHALLELGSSANFALYKTYGNFSPQNPLSWRYDEQFGRGVDIKYRAFYPLDQAEMRQRYAISVADRTGAALARIAADGAYAPPTIA